MHTVVTGQGLCSREMGLPCVRRHGDVARWVVYRGMEMWVDGRELGQAMMKRGTWCGGQMAGRKRD